MRSRFIVEGEWSGYVSSQRRVVHRTVHTLHRAAFEKIHDLRFTDGTALYITVRDAKFREKVEVKDQYSTALMGAVYKGLTGSIDITKT